MQRDSSPWKFPNILPEDAKIYFSTNRNYAAIKIYAELNHKVLKEMAQEVKICFPADAMVVEKTKGQMKICDVTVGDRLLTVSTDGTLHYEDVFMLGEYLKNFTYVVIILNNQLYYRSFGAFFALMTMHKIPIISTIRVVCNDYYCPQTKFGAR